MRTDSLFKRYEIFVAASIIAAHASKEEKIFRQRDVRFMLELFTNWIEASLPEDGILISNTQILRYLEKLEEEGFIRKINKKPSGKLYSHIKGQGPFYKLNRLGLIELLSRMRSASLVFRPENYFFLDYFLVSYKEIISELIEKEGNKFPLALKLEIDDLFNREELRANLKKRVKKEINKLRARKEEARKSADLSTRLFRKGESINAAAKEIEKLYPYGLNSKKPLSELIASVPKKLARHELETGNKERSEKLWGPMLAVLERYLGELERLK